MKLLILTSRFPYPIEKGDKLRIYHQIRELAKYHEITLCAVSNHDVTDEDFLAVSRFCTRVEILKKWKFSFWKNTFNVLFGKLPGQVALFYDKKLKRKFNQIVNEVQPDHIYVQLIRAAPYAADVNVPKTIDFMDNYSRWTKKLSRHWKFPFANMFLNWEAKKVAAYEKLMFNKFDGHTIITEQDKEAFQFLEKSKIHCVGNGVDTDFFQPDPKIKKKYDVAFVGNLSYINNVEAAKYIAHSVLPLVKKEIPECRFLIAGASPSQELKKLENENLKIQGWLDDIRDAYAWSRIFIAPIFLAVGQQNKILEAMSMGLPCVTTHHVNNAIGAEPGESILLADDAASFAKEIIFLLKNDEVEQSVSEKGLLFVRKNFSWESSVKTLRDILEIKSPI